MKNSDEIRKLNIRTHIDVIRKLKYITERTSYRIIIKGHLTPKATLDFKSISMIAD